MGLYVAARTELVCESAMRKPLERQSTHENFLVDSSAGLRWHIVRWGMCCRNLNDHNTDTQGVRVIVLIHTGPTDKDAAQ